MENIDRDEVLRVVKMRGPLIPNEVKRILGKGDTTLLGAILGELSSKGLVKVSKTKLGSSPFYYDPSRPESLERIGQHLGEKDQRTFNLLKEKKVLRDDRQEALIRVSLRNIKDFARMLTVNAPGGQVVYWKYFTIPDREAEAMIKTDLGMKKAGSAPEPAPATPQPAPPPNPTPEALRPEQPRQESAGSTAMPAHPPRSQGSQASTGGREKREKAKDEKEKSEATQQSLAAEPEPIHDEFYAKVKRYFDRQGIAIKEQKLIRKKSELDFVLLLPTPVGTVEYYCKAKAKKKSNDGDLASAKLQGQSRNLPVLYLTTGEITKKAKEKLNSDFKGLVVKEL